MGYNLMDAYYCELGLEFGKEQDRSGVVLLNCTVPISINLYL